MIQYKRFCERCERVTKDGHLWCQDRDCQADQGYPVFDYGDYIADMKIVKLIACWRTAALYEAQRNDKPVWVKVAHHHPPYEQRLRDEAAFAQSQAPKMPGFIAAFFAQPRPKQLVWLRPFPPPDDSKAAHGEITLDGQPRIFCVYHAIKGSLLSDVLLENPSLWHYEAAWITITLAEALVPTANQGQAHLCLCPEMIYVEKDSDSHWRPTLMDFGWLLKSGASRIGVADVQRAAVPAYAAPELLGRNAANGLAPLADTYSLGLILYEMLEGHPGFDAKIARDDSVRQQVTARSTGLKLQRAELRDAAVVGVVERAISLNQRYATVGEFGRAIVNIYGEPPREKRPVPLRFKIVVGVICALLVAMVGVGLYLLLRG